MAPRQCGVCVETFNKSNRKPIVCIHCDFEACASCVSRVLTESPHDPRCMQCTKAWGKDFLVENFTKKFVNDTLKKHRENQLFEREQSLLPATQPAVEREIEKERLVQQRLDFNEKKRALKEQIIKVTQDIQALDHSIFRLDNATTEVVEKDKRQFVRRCPVNDCRGFLSTAWKCGICETWTCPDCHEPKGHEKTAPHECKPENVETAKLLARDTKPCPKCAVPIHRLSGCNQMFCTSCHTPWNWQTGKVESGPIHNPHYFEIRNRLGGEAANNNEHDFDPCANTIPNITRINTNLRKLGLLSTDVNGVNLPHYIQWITHQFDVVRRTYIVNELNNNVDLRIKYMMNKIDEARFKQLLQQREKAIQKKREIEQVIASAYALTGDIIRVMIQAKTASEATARIDELKQLVTFAHDGMQRVADKYGGKVPSMVYNF